MSAVVQDEGGFYRAVDAGKATRSRVNIKDQLFDFKYRKASLLDINYRAHLFYTLHQYGYGERHSLLES